MTNRQEVMLNDNVNLNFQYDEKLYKLGVNIHEGIITLEKIISEKETELKNIILLERNLPCTEVQEVVESDSKQEETKE